MKTRILATLIILLSAVSFGFSQPKEGSPQPPSLKDRIGMIEERICKPLNLDKQQTEKVSSAFNEFFKGMENLVDKSTIHPMRPERSKIEILEKIRDERVRLVIPAALFPKYLELELAGRPKGPGDSGHGPNI
ncbi:MAG: hypothetical protein NTV75_07030 [Bacteroidia bacterium]|nr:hypothetical protein [Bacteroidia bacterium]